MAVVLVMLFLMEGVPMGNSRLIPEGMAVPKNRIAKTERVVLNRRSLAADEGTQERGKGPAPKLKSPNPGPSRPVGNPEAPSPPPPLYSSPPPYAS